MSVYYRPYTTTAEHRAQLISILESIRRTFTLDGEPNAAVVWNRSFPVKDTYDGRDTDFFTGINGIYIIDTLTQEDGKEYYRFQFNKGTYICYEFVEVGGIKYNYINYFMSTLAAGGGAKMLYDFLSYLKTQAGYSTHVLLTPDPNLHKYADFEKLKEYYRSLGFNPIVEGSMDYKAEIDTIQSNILSKFLSKKGGRRRRTHKRRKSNKRGRKSNKKRRSNKRRIFNIFL
jgi:hypothetical protein